MSVCLRRWTGYVTATLILFMAVAMSSDAKDFLEIKVEVLQQCQGMFKDKVPTEQQLYEIIDKHKEWYVTYDFHKRFTTEAQSDPRKANLCGADLQAQDLTGVNLSFADLSGAILLEVDLTGADLEYANLSGTHMGLATLENSRLYGTNLIGAFLAGANLNGVKLIESKLSSAWMGSDTDLRGVVFEPTDLPDVKGMAEADYLSQMSFDSKPEALFSLRKAFREAGYYKQEREVTFAIKNTETSKLLDLKGLSYNQIISLLEGLFNYIFFDFTTHWGMTPGRALRILLALIPIYAIPYIIALRSPGPNGIWLKWLESRIRLDLGMKEPTRLQVEWPKAIVLGLYFSMLSAFSIGWREINVGNWIQRLQKNEYTLQATGWVRSVSGMQSLSSGYLLAIWALTYFSRPFE